MLDEARPFSPWQGDDRSRPLGLPPDAPLPMPLQLLERRRAQSGWLRFLSRRAL